MLEDRQTSDWETGLNFNGLRFPEDYYVKAALDMDTIFRKAETAEDRALALQTAAQFLKDGNHDVRLTRRSKDDDAWIALCKL
tara:strand:- start:1619 stop:1867 length:249 start_codon:yes stop_codon:yes gene_type:complete